MNNELYDPVLDNPGNILTPTSPDQLLEILDRGLPRLSKMPPGLNRKFETVFSLPTDSIWKQLFGPLFTRTKVIDKPIPVRLEPLAGVRQQTGSDCVGAVTMAVLSQITGLPINSKLYEGFLITALKHRLATQEQDGIRVDPFVINILKTPEFESTYGIKSSIILRNELTLAELSEIARSARTMKNPYELFILNRVASWKNPGGDHLVAMQEIMTDGVVIYDPGEAKPRNLSFREFMRRWDYVENSAILIFVRSGLATER